MKYKSFSAHLFNNVVEAIHWHKQQNQPLIAAFDADGTLWNTDIGENFFDYLITNKKVLLPQDPWAYYLNLKKISPPRAYFWLAQILKGIPVNLMREWTYDALIGYQTNPVFYEQQELIAKLKEMGVQIFIITASVKWSVEAAAQKWLSIDADHVLGIETEILFNHVTDHIINPATYREGKVNKLLSVTDNLRPFFACGNSEGDLELLSSATHIALAVQSCSPDSKLGKSEAVLKQKAISSNWATYRF